MYFSLRQGSEKTTIIDMATARNLEIVANLQTLTEQGSLYDVLNYTKTHCGQRLLRSELLQPPSDAATATHRLASVGEVIDNDEL